MNEVIEKYDMTDATFMFPIYVDTPERIRNLRICVNWLEKHFNTNYIICEQTTDLIPEMFKDINYHYIHLNIDKDGLIHRTRQLNIMTHLVKTKIVVNIDCDILLEKSQYITAYENIKNNQFDVVYPYAGKFVNVSEADIKKFDESGLDFDVFRGKNFAVLHPNSRGGVIFFKRDVYIKGGMENENFLSWGYEDNERYHRFKKLGYRINRVPGVCFHLDHPREINSSPKNPKYNINKTEYFRINRMNNVQLQHEISTWPWTKN
jgi:hypothetical protein